MNISDDPIPSGTYQAGDKIILSGRVPSGNQVIFRAPNSVDVLPEFGADWAVKWRYKQEIAVIRDSNNLDLPVQEAWRSRIRVWN